MQQSTDTQIAKLEQTITKLEANNLQAFQKQILSSLYHLREVLVKDIKSLGDVPEKSASNVDENGELIDPKDKKIAELEAQIKKLNYRIVHLSKNLRQKLG